MMPNPPFDPATGEWARPPAASAGPSADALPPDPDGMLRRRDGEATFWTILLALDLAYLAFAAVTGIIVGLTLVLAPQSQAGQRIAESSGHETLQGLLLGVAITFAAVGVLPFLWIWRTRAGGWAATKAYLRLHAPGRSIATGILGGFILVAASLAVATLYLTGYQAATGHSYGSENHTNPVTDSIANNLNWTVVVVVGLAAGIGEEILFRGFLMRQLGWWPQAILFAIAHATNAEPLQIVITLGIGLSFGWWLKRGGSLYTTIAAHATYDILLLAIGLLARKA